MPYFDPVDAQVEGGAQALGEVWALALAWKTYQVRTQSFEVTSQNYFSGNCRYEFVKPGCKSTQNTIGKK
jgi:hypothetical protein